MIRRYLPRNTSHVAAILLRPSARQLHPNSYFVIVKTSQIRLIHILPELSSFSCSRVAEPIQCILSYVSLDDNPRYNSLPYTWQDETLGESFENLDQPCPQIPIDPYVFLEGERIAVTPTLWSALWHLRRTARWYLENPGLEGPEFPEDKMFNDEDHCRFKFHIPL
jgi:hypothetical protein